MLISFFCFLCGRNELRPCDLMLCFDAASSVMPFIEEDRRRAGVVTTGQKTDQKTDQKVQLTDLQQKVLDFLGANHTATRDNHQDFPFLAVTIMTI